MTNTSDKPITIQADILVFSLEPILQIKEAQNIRCQFTTYSTQNDEETEDIIERLSTLTKFEGE